MIESKNPCPEERITKSGMRRFLTDERLKNVICLECVDSTNNYLKKHEFENAPDGLTVVSNFQTAGRGRSGRSFLSPDGKGIYMSMLVRPECSPSEAIPITACVAVAVADAVNRICGVTPGIKWVNDLVLNRKKICGILTELLLNSDGSIKYIIVGIGLNVSEKSDDFPEDIRGIASSLLAQTGTLFSGTELVCGIISSLDRMRNDWLKNKSKYLDFYRNHCVTVGNDVSVISGSASRRAFAEGINDDFSLRVRYTDGSTENLSCGEVSVRGLYGYV